MLSLKTVPREVARDLRSRLRKNAEARISGANLGASPNAKACPRTWIRLWKPAEGSRVRVAVSSLQSSTSSATGRRNP